VRVVRAQQRLAVEADFGIGIQPVEAQLGIGLGQRRRIHVEARAVLPGRQADPLQLGLGAPTYGSRISACASRSVCTLPGTRRTPLLQAWMGGALRVAGQHAELPLCLQRRCSCREGGRCDQQQEQTDNEGKTMHAELLFFRRAWPGATDSDSSCVWRHAPQRTTFNTS
jgi:hypothetical protein